MPSKKELLRRIKIYNACQDLTQAQRESITLLTPDHLIIVTENTEIDPMQWGIYLFHDKMFLQVNSDGTLDQCNEKRIPSIILTDNEKMYMRAFFTNRFVLRPYANITQGGVINAYC